MFFLILLPSIILLCLVMISSEIWRCLSYLMIMVSRLRNSCCLTNLSLCNIIFSASNSCTRNIKDSSSRSSSEVIRSGSSCGKPKIKPNQWLNLNCLWLLKFQSKLKFLFINKLRFYNNKLDFFIFCFSTKQKIKHCNSTILNFLKFKQS